MMVRLWFRKFLKGGMDYWKFSGVILPFTLITITGLFFEVVWITALGVLGVWLVIIYDFFLSVKDANREVRSAIRSKETESGESGRSMEDLASLKRGRDERDVPRATSERRGYPWHRPIRRN